MPRFSNKRRVQHSAPEMFDLVADVERYPEFVPLCQSLKVRQRTPQPDGTEVVVADMTVSFKLVKEILHQRVTLDRANLKILVEYLSGPFSNLENRWTFEPKGDNACDVGFFIAYEFKSRMLALLMGSMFDAAFARFSAAFEKRADAIYGKRAVVGVTRRAHTPIQLSNSQTDKYEYARNLATRITPPSCSQITSLRVQGAGKAGCPLHPQPRMQSR